MPKKQMQGQQIMIKIQKYVVFLGHKHSILVFICRDNNLDWWGNKEIQTQNEAHDFPPLQILISEIGTQK